MMPVSSASSPVDTAGSIATTIRTRSGIFRWTGQRVSSISAWDQRAPGTSSNISALSSCRPSRVPSYLRTICCRNAGARLARLSYVEPRVINVVGSAISLADDFDRLWRGRDDDARVVAKAQPEHQHVPRLWIPPGGDFITPRCVVLR